MAQLKTTHIAGNLTVEGAVQAPSFTSPDGSSYVLVDPNLASRANVLPKFESNTTLGVIKSIISDDGSTATISGNLTTTGITKVKLASTTSPSRVLTVETDASSTAQEVKQVLVATADTPNALVARDGNGGTTLRALQLKKSDGTPYLDASNGLVKLFDSAGFNVGTAGYKAVRTYTQADAKPAMILLAPVYTTASLPKTGFMGTVYRSKGSESASHISEKYDIICTTAYDGAKLVCTGSNPDVRIVQTVYNNTDYFALYCPSTTENRITFDGLFFGEPIELSDATGYPVTEVSYNVNNAQTNLDTHANATTGIHGATSAATADKLIIRDSSGRAEVADPDAHSPNQIVNVNYLNYLRPGGVIYRESGWMEIDNGAYVEKFSVSFLSVGGIVRVNLGLSRDNAYGWLRGYVTHNGVTVLGECTKSGSGTSWWSADVAVCRGDVIRLYAKLDSGYGGYTDQAYLSVSVAFMA